MHKFYALFIKPFQANTTIFATKKCKATYLQGLTRIRGLKRAQNCPSEGDPGTQDVLVETPWGRSLVPNLTCIHPR